MTSETMTPPVIPPPPRDLISDVTQQLSNLPSLTTANSDTVAAGRASPSKPAIDSAGNHGVADELLDEMPRLSHFKVLDSKDYADKYRKYESECTQMLMAKYFSGKNIHGGNIFEEKTNIGDETILSSRWPCTRSYADPIRYIREQDDEVSVPMEKSPSEIPNGDLHLGQHN